MGGGPNGKPQPGEFPKILESVSWLSDPETKEVTMTYRCKADNMTREDIKQVVNELFLEGVTWLEIKLPSPKSDIVRCSECQRKIQ